ncbi:phosphodiester glycosidase family protein [Paenibacillus sp. 32352]|uniref:phosphodiester glycosidase family protein n=1 Tax=Paenibacillus sp. 32352 TaxID=1969111 RepID=UPI0009AE1D54|nr:phosphodiester glycosidase family protein [Paenibacillus sp. 32352]
MSQDVEMMQERRRQAWQIVQTEESTAPGVRYWRQQVSKGALREAVHMVEVDPSHELVQLKPVSFQGKVVRLETVGNLLHELETQGQRCVAGFNGDFFSYAGVPSGLHMVDGEIITSPLLTKVMLVMMNDGSIKLEESVRMSAVVQCESGYNMSVDMVNRARKAGESDQACVYTWRYGDSTRTPAGGIEAIVAVNEAEVNLYPGVPIRGIVQSIGEAFDSPMEVNSWVLSLTGWKARAFLEQAAPGTALTLSIQYDKEIQNARQVLSGNSTLAFMLLKDGKIPEVLLDSRIRLNSDRHPRTIAAVKQGKLYLAAIDGRQPGHSDGMTLLEAACFLQEQGMEHAINLDGGGSTTCYIRRPGDERATLVNQPSDGFEREIGNALAIVTQAPKGELDTLIVIPSAVRAMTGSKVAFQVKGRDRYGNASPVDGEQLHWSLEGCIGSILEKGVWMAGPVPADGRIIVRYGNVVQSVPVLITNRAARLKLVPSCAEVEPGGNLSFRALAFDADGNEVLVSNELLSWSTEGETGKWEEPGYWAAGAVVGRGRVKASLGDIHTFADVHVGKSHYMIADFESLNGIGTEGVNTVEGSVTITKAARPSPVRFGTFSGRWTYDFTGKPGISEARMTFVKGTGDRGHEIEGAPYRFGLWVNGDGSSHGLRLEIVDADGIRRFLNFTDSDGLYWKGWKYVCTEVPENTRLPIRVHTIVLEEANDAKKTKGVLYLDHFRAEYVDFDEDVEGPEFSGMRPSDHAVVTTCCPLIQVTVKDSKSGVDTASIRVWLNDAVLPHTFCKDTGILECKPLEPLEKGVHRVTVEAADMMRNAALPAATWSFQII